MALSVIIMNMSQTISAVVINLLVMVLPLIGVSVGSEQLTNAVQVIVAIATGAWIWYRRVQVGDVTPLGLRK